MLLPCLFCHIHSCVVPSNQHQWPSVHFQQIQRFVFSATVQGFPLHPCSHQYKEHYQKGGLGDVKIKKFLNNILQEELKPIREKREAFQKDLPSVYQILIEGTKKARAKAAATTHSVRSAMKINYFEGM